MIIVLGFGFKEKTKAVCGFDKRRFEGCTIPRWTGEPCEVPPGGVLVEIFGGGVPPASPNPDPISDLKMPFPIDLASKNPYPFSDLTLYVIKHNR